jgi:hypothetical protein
MIGAPLNGRDIADCSTVVDIDLILLSDPDNLMIRHDEMEWRQAGAAERILPRDTHWGGVMQPRGR